MAERPFAAIVRREDDLFVAECPEVGTVSQGPTFDEAGNTGHTAAVGSFPGSSAHTLQRTIACGTIGT
jgi:hypothetical protein